MANKNFDINYIQVSLERRVEKTLFLVNTYIERGEENKKILYLLF